MDSIQMYQPPHFREDRKDVLHDLIKNHPLAMLISAGEQGLIANPIPFTLINKGPKGLLRAHLAKANGQIADLRAGIETLVIFQGPASYISPSWYASKAEHGKVVPTWNYVIVQARGAARVIDDALWLRTQLDHITNTQENSKPMPWHVDDAPEPFVKAQIKGIVGLEIPIERIEGKWKVSQNRPTADRESVAHALKSDQGMATLVINRGAVTSEKL